MTRRMKWIVKQMREYGAVIQESCDEFFEVSTWWLWWQDDVYHEYQVTERIRGLLIEAGQIECVERTSVYGKGGKFVAQEKTYAATVRG